MTIVDWREVDSRALALVFARERARWLVELGWETRDSWLHVERARTTWGLPGLAAIDDGGRVRGLTFLHHAQGRCDIGGVFAESDAVRTALLTAALQACEDAGAEEIGAFLYCGPFDAARVLETHGFDSEYVDYLVRAIEHAQPALDAPLPAGLVSSVWSIDAAEALAELLHTSYEPAAARRFVAQLGLPGWRHYVNNLVRHAACGQLLPSVAETVWNDSQLVAAVVVTELGPATAHIAQVAVHPDWRRHHLAARLIERATHRIRTSGFNRVTLLVSSRNTAAQTLYRGSGFTDLARFVSGLRSRTTTMARAS